MMPLADVGREGALPLLLLLPLLLAPRQLAGRARCNSGQARGKVPFFANFGKEPCPVNL